ncbi:mediator of RNA polymerase II transcription subunit 1-domain-containing protein [Lineolata rhizophorae]|uniref:Mediator of RNA polymerase II transcription subunit 1 n=1 Tax=Lineolata rhizophorae TaxID=578093 RepID=A0A6A6P457_9PEZI|nr:mediator of RNA polymerase II transcription subunit 1-domain-containing protein [Lineolata rhizophorae]
MEGGVGMGLSMSGMSGLGLGTGSSVGGGFARAVDDEERRKRLETVVAMLATKKGRVSEEGVERVARKLGLECLWEEKGGKGSASTERRRLLSIAGQTVLVDIHFKSNTVESVAVSFPSSSEAVTAHAASAARILQSDLTPPPTANRFKAQYAYLTLTLDKFARNLERTAKLDKLSTPELNCYEAIAGVYDSLKRLFEHEKKAALATLKEKNEGLRVRVSDEELEERAEREVLCKKSGRPRMNAGDLVGLSLEYLMDQRHIMHKPTPVPLKQGHASATQQDSMDVDPKPQDEKHEPPNKVFSLSIECESFSPSLYPPLRISDSWLPHDPSKIEQAREDPLFSDQAGSSTGINWLEPDQTFIPQGETSAGAMDLDPTAGGGSKLPSARFVAKLNPPVALPYGIAMQVLESVGATIPEEMVRFSTFEALVLKGDGVLEADGSGPQFQGKETVMVVGNAKDGAKRDLGDRVHENRLYVPKPDYARVIEEIPFSHPRQLVDVLPLLRQYAFLATLLSRSFPEQSQSGSNTSSTAPHPSSSTQHAPNSPTSDNATPLLPSIPVDFSLWYLATEPHLSVVFPRPPPSHDASTPNSTAHADSSAMDVDKPAPTATAVAAPWTTNVASHSGDGREGTSLDGLLAAGEDRYPRDLVAIELAVGVNGDVSVASMDGLRAAGGEEGAENVERRRARVGRGVEVSGGLGVWVEWVAREY